MSTMDCAVASRKKQLIPLSLTARHVVLTARVLQGISVVTDAQTVRTGASCKAFTFTAEE